MAGSILTGPAAAGGGTAARREETFSGLGCAAFFTERLQERNIQVPTAIQALVIPRILAGENTLFRSATGTGKTFAYLIPVFQSALEALDSPGGPLILIASPTLELCAQIKGEADFLLERKEGKEGKEGKTKTGLFIGSASIQRQIEALRREKPRIIVGNPARLLQLERMGKLNLGKVRFLVLDEGDRLTAEELAEDTRALAGAACGERLTVSCSATVSGKSRERILPLMGRAPVFIESEEHEILRERIRHWALYSGKNRKADALRDFLAASRAKKALVFTGRGADAGVLVSRLQAQGIAAAGLYSDLDRRDKHARRRAFDDFKAGRARVLVSSDLAARGLDIPGITHVIQLDVPAGEEPYIHRAGRTARAGKQGVMVTIGDREELARFAALEKKLGITVYPKILSQGRIRAPEGMPSIQEGTDDNRVYRERQYGRSADEGRGKNHRREHHRLY
ncbi:MAG: DEAD/DEAH box helicase [Spirochaetaceae bacterium]|jgi:superfamily II DNA/RNA helicase|nr:DEAD/DEAH box helicase [Spirochaetaceae bacterium]